MKQQPPKKTDEEILEELLAFGEKAIEGLFNPENFPDFDEKGILAGDKELLEKTDAQLFPDETEEYTKEEKKPRIVINNKPK